MRKWIGVLVLISTVGVFSNAVQGQVLISLLFGDKLNSGNVEFGLEGGLNRSYLADIAEAEGKNNFNLGFFFNIKMKEKLYFETGVLVKSNVGATNIKPYTTGQEEIDLIFANGGSVTRDLSYFYVPLFLQYRFDSHFYLSAGPQLGLLSKAKDVFIYTDYGSGDLEYVIKNRSAYNPIDAGVGVDLGYRLLEGVGMSFGVKYYHGLTNIYKSGNQKGNNSSLNFYARIPIGAGKAKQTEEE